MTSPSVASTSTSTTSTQSQSALALASAFCRSFYSQQHNAPEHLYTFYEDDSVVQRQRENNPELMQQAEGQMAIHELFMARRTQLSSARVEVLSIDSVDCLNNSVLICVRGRLLPVNRLFSHTFLLKQIEVEAKKTYYIRSDMLRLDVETVQLSQLENVKETSESATSMDFKQVDHSTQTDRNSMTSPVQAAVIKADKSPVASRDSATSPSMVWISEKELAKAETVTVKSPNIKQQTQQQPTQPAQSASRQVNSDKDCEDSKTYANSPKTGNGNTSLKTSNSNDKSAATSNANKKAAEVAGTPAPAAANQNKANSSASVSAGATPSTNTSTATTQNNTTTAATVPAAKLNWAQRAANSAQTNGARPTTATTQTQVSNAASTQNPTVNAVKTESTVNAQTTLSASTSNSSLNTNNSNANNNNNNSGFQTAPHRHHGNRPFKPHFQQNGAFKQRYQQSNQQQQTYKHKQQNQHTAANQPTQRS